MKVWLTGCRGMLAQAISAELRELGAEWLGTDREVDLADEHRVLEFAGDQGFSHVVNCAAFTAVDEAESRPEEALRANAHIPRCLGRTAARLGLTLLHFSSDYVFDGQASQPYSESAVPAPLNVYGRTKAAGEQALLDLVTRGPGRIRGYVVRNSWLFGPGGKNFVSTMLELMQEREVVAVVADQQGRPTYTVDLARAALELVGVRPRRCADPEEGTEREEAATASGAKCGSGSLMPATCIPGRSERICAEPGLYHFANSGPTTWHGLATRILSLGRELGWPLRTQRVEPVTSAEYRRPAPRPAYSVLDTTRIEATLGWVPRHWEQALRDYLGLLASPRRG